MTNLRRTIVAAVVSVALAGAWSESAATGGSLEGSWRLVEQRYQKGSGDLAVPDDALELDFAGGERPRASVRFGSGASHEWPAVVAEGEPVPVTVVERTIDFTAGAAVARYRLSPDGGPGWTLELTEEYRVDEKGVLRGTLAVRMIEDGEQRGGYVLNRRFERRP